MDNKQQISSLPEDENDLSEDYQSRMEQITKLQKEIELRQQRLKTFDKNVRYYLTFIVEFL